MRPPAPQIEPHSGATATPISYSRTGATGECGSTYSAPPRAPRWRGNNWSNGAGNKNYYATFVSPSGRVDGRLSTAAIGLASRFAFRYYSLQKLANSRLLRLWGAAAVSPRAPSRVPRPSVAPRRSAPLLNAPRRSAPSLNAPPRVAPCRAPSVGVPAPRVPAPSRPAHGRPASSSPALSLPALRRLRAAARRRAALLARANASAAA